jgi:hypothetical protein
MKECRDSISGRGHPPGLRKPAASVQANRTYLDVSLVVITNCPVSLTKSMISLVSLGICKWTLESRSSREIDLSSPELNKSAFPPFDALRRTRNIASGTQWYERRSTCRSDHDLLCVTEKGRDERGHGIVVEFLSLPVDCYD